MIPMKTVLFAAALLMSGAALAQTTDTTTTDTTVTTTTTTSTPSTVAPSNAAPERDARGIPVISDPAMAPAGANQAVVVPPGAQVVPNPNQAAAFQTQASTDSYPACSRTVTDNCVQTYERPRG
jgi:hypothetical protein